MAAAIQVVSHFYWSHCLVCYKEQTPSAPLLRCSRCHSAPYCSPTHQRAHWKKHKQLCTFMSESAEEEQHSFFSHMVGSTQEDWTEFITSSVPICSFFLGRPLSQQEKEMFLFSRSCQVSSCHSVTGHPDMVDCLDCLCVSYCSQEHKKQDKESHALGCKQLKLARVLDRQEMMTGVRVPSLAPFQDIEYMGTSKDIRTHVVQLEYARLGLGPVEEEDVEKMVMDDISDDPEVMDIAMDFALLTNLLTGPLTVLDIGHKFIPSFSTKNSLTVHVVGANFFEMVAMLKWEYLAHRLPALNRLDYAFVGPEWGEEGRKAGKFATIPSCPDCEDMGRSISYREYTGVYQEFKKSEGTTQPDILIVQNCGFAEFPDDEKNESWIHGWAFGLGSLLAPGVVLAFTSYSRKEAEEDFERFMKYCGKREEEVEVLAKCVENGMRGRRPVRDHAREDGDVFYNNQFISVLKIKEEQ